MAGMVKRADFLENEVVDLTEEIKLVSPTDTPLTTLLMGRGQVVPANDITVTWREKELNSDRGTLKLEGSEAGEAITSGRKTLSNVCQIIEKVTQVSGTARSLNPKGIGDVFNSEVQDRLVETKRDMEWYFLNGTKALESGSTPRQMNGLVNLVASGNVVETKGALTEEHFLDALQEMWKHGAQGEYFSFVNANIKRMINDLAKAGNNVRFLGDNGSMQNVLGIGVQKIVTDFGEISLVLDRYADTKTSLDAQRKVGRGVCDFTDDGKTNMAVVTGATSGLGNGSGIDPNGGVDGKCSVSYRGEENLWGNIWTWLDKVNILAKGQNEVFVHEIGATVADDTTTGYKSLGYHWSHSNGYQSAFGIDPEHPELLIPTEASGSDVFTGNYVWQNYTYNGFLVARLGGRWTDGSSCGFALNGITASGDRYRYFGGRLLYVPQTKVA